MRRCIVFAWVLLSVAVHAAEPDKGRAPAFANPAGTPAVKHWSRDCQTLEQCRTGAEAGESEAQYRLAMMYLNGAGVARDMAQAVKWIKKAADAGEAHAEYQLGVMLRDGIGMAANEDDALRWLRLSATWGLPEAKKAAADIERHETLDASEALIARANRGDVEAQHKLALAYLNGQSGLERNPERAREWFAQAANKNYFESAYELAKLYRDGLGGDVDITQAKQWLHRAADGGLIKARVALTDLERVQADAVKSNSQQPLKNAAAHPYLDGAQRGDAQAQLELGQMLLRGEGTKRDVNAALTWLRKSATQDYTPAQLFLGDALLQGLDVEQDYDEAAKWYLRAAQRGNAEAQYVMGNLYSVGLGVKADAKESRRWYTAAAKQGHAKARERIAPKQ